MRPDKINIRILTPTRVLLDTHASKVVAEAENGSFCLLPLHVDFVSALQAGILSYETPEGAEHHVAIDAGIMVKCGGDVMVSTGNAVLGDDLSALRRAIEDQVRDRDEHEQVTRSALNKLETSIVRRFMELGARYRG